MSEVQQAKLLSTGAPPSILLSMTAVSGMVDAVSFLALGHVFTANMTGNVVFLGFAIGGAAGLSVSGSLMALICFAVGALLGGWMTRKMISHASAKDPLGVSPHSADAPAKTMTPIVTIFRWPTVSASRPPNANNAASDSR